MFAFLPRLVCRQEKFLVLVLLLDLVAYSTALHCFVSAHPTRLDCRFSYDATGSAFALLFFPHVAMAYDAKMYLTCFGLPPQADEPMSWKNHAAKSRVMDISYLHLDIEQTRGKVIRLEDGDENMPQIRKKVILEDDPGTGLSCDDFETSERDRSKAGSDEVIYDGISGWVEVNPTDSMDNRVNSSSLNDDCFDKNQPNNYTHPAYPMEESHSAHRRSKHFEGVCHRSKKSRHDRFNKGNGKGNGRSRR